MNSLRRNRVKNPIQAAFTMMYTDTTTTTMIVATSTNAVVGS